MEENSIYKPGQWIRVLNTGKITRLYRQSSASYNLWITVKHSKVVACEYTGFKNSSSCDTSQEDDGHYYSESEFVAATNVEIASTLIPGHWYEAGLSVNSNRYWIQFNSFSGTSFRSTKYYALDVTGQPRSTVSEGVGYFHNIIREINTPEGESTSANKAIVPVSREIGESPILSVPEEPEYVRCKGDYTTSNVDYKKGKIYKFPPISDNGKSWELTSLKSWEWAFEPATWLQFHEQQSRFGKDANLSVNYGTNMPTQAYFALETLIAGSKGDFNPYDLGPFYDQDLVQEINDYNYHLSSKGLYTPRDYVDYLRYHGLEKFAVRRYFPLIPDECELQELMTPVLINNELEDETLIVATMIK